MFLFKYQVEIVCLIVFLHIHNSYLTPLLPKRKKRKEKKEIFKKYQTNNKENFSHFFYR